MSPAKAAVAPQTPSASPGPVVDHESIHEAVSAALGMFQDLERTRTAKVDMKGGGGYSYSYTDLADVLGYVRPLLALHGLVLTNPVGMREGVVSVRTRFLFRDGTEDLSPEILYPFSGTPQQFGGLVTYLRRYSTLASCGLATEDNDGAGGPSAPAPSRAPVARKVPPPRQDEPPRSRPDPRDPAPSSTSSDPPSRGQFVRLQVLMKDAHMVDRGAKLAWVSRVLDRDVESTNDVSSPEADVLIAALEDLAGRDPWNLHDPDAPPEERPDGYGD